MRLKILCITWTPKGSRRMYDLRSVLGADIWNYSVFYRVRVLSPIKYPFQALKTFIKLVESKPSVVIVQNPPIFAALTCLIYSMFYPVKVIVDHHFVWSMSGLIRNPVARAFIDSIERRCVRKASLNTTYADYWDRELVGMGAENVLVVYDFVDETWPSDADRSIRERFPKEKKVVAVPCGGHALERPDLLIEACKGLDVTVVITGERRYLQRHIARARELNAGNVVFTGFLPDKQYRGLIATCDFAANISDEPYGIPHLATEALASKRPIIISKNPAVEKLLGEEYPAIIPTNDVKTIRDAVSSALEKQGEYVRQTIELYGRLERQREKQLERLSEYIRH